MDGIVHIGAAARLLGVTPHHLRMLEREGRIPPVRRDLNGRVYSRFDIALLRSLKRLSKWLGRWAVATVLEEAPSVLSRHRVQRPPQCLDQGLAGPRFGLA